MRSKKNRNWMLEIIFFSIILFSGCQKNIENTTELLTLPIVTGTISNSLTFIGNVASSQSSELTWRTTGVVEEVLTSLGNSVEEGQVLAGLEVESVPAEVPNAEISFIEAQDALSDLQISETAKAQAYKDLRDKEVALRDAKLFAEGLKYPVASQEDIDAAKKVMDGAKDAYENAATEYQSVILRDHLDEQKKSLYQTLQDTLNSYAKAYDLWLYDVNNTSEKTKEQAAADIKVAEAAYEQALKTFKTYAKGFPRDKDLKPAQQTLADTQENYGKRYIAADISGTVTMINARPGDYVTKGTVAIRIDNLDRIFIPINISEIDIVKIENGQEADVILDSVAEKTFKGIVYKVSRQGDESNNSVSFETFVEIMDPDNSIKVGMTAEIHIILEKKSGVMLTASNAIYKENDQFYLEILKDGNRKKIPVLTGMTDGTITEISSAEISEGDLAIVPSTDSHLLSELGLPNAELQEDSGTLPSPFSNHMNDQEASDANFALSEPTFQTTPISISKN